MFLLNSNKETMRIFLSCCYPKALWLTCNWPMNEQNQKFLYAICCPYYRSVLQTEAMRLNEWCLGHNSAVRLIRILVWIMPQMQSIIRHIDLQSSVLPLCHGAGPPPPPNPLIYEWSKTELLNAICCSYYWSIIQYTNTSTYPLCKQTETTRIK